MTKRERTKWKQWST